MRSAKLLVAAYLVLSCLALAGCTPNTPAVLADNAGIASANTSLTALKSQLSTLLAQQSAGMAINATQPSAVDLSPITTQIAAVKAQIAATQASLTTLNNQRVADGAAATAAAVGSAVTTAQGAASNLPGIYGVIAVAAIGIGGALAKDYINGKKDAAVSANHSAATQTQSDNLRAVATQSAALLQQSTPIINGVLPASAQPAAVAIENGVGAALNAIAAEAPAAATTTTTTTTVVPPAAATPAV